MPLFPWSKKPDDASKGPAANAGATGAAAGSTTTSSTGDTTASGFEFSPAKAEAWFRHARVSTDAGNHEYALTCWLSGLRFQPDNLESTTKLFDSAAQYGKAPSKDVLKAVNGSSDLDRYLRSIVEWACSPKDAYAAGKALAEADRVGLADIAKWVAPRALVISAQADKPRKDQLVRIMELCEKNKLFDLACKAGEVALRLDPADKALSDSVRNLSAQSTMSRGGYENTGQSGGFRSNIRDAAKQRALEESESLVKSEDAQARNIETARAAYLAAPLDKPGIKRYLKALMERGTPDDQRAFIDTANKAFADTQEFSFRQLAGEMRVKQLTVEARALQRAAAANPGDATAAAAFSEKERQLLTLEIEEYTVRAEAYPTDLVVKLELGRRMFLAGKYNEAIELLQQAQNEPRQRLTAMDFLGRSFEALKWHDEAIEVFRGALTGASEAGDQAVMELQYSLMAALQARAEESKQLASAEEAFDLAKKIALKQITFKDIRARREQLKALVDALKAGG